jgi:putative ABC transport system permease protein
MLASAAVETFLFGVTARDPWTLVTAALVLTVIAFVAGYVPARRAARVNPALALRAE